MANIHLQNLVGLASRDWEMTFETKEGTIVALERTEKVITWAGLEKIFTLLRRQEIDIPSFVRCVVDLIY
jgi:hypothetical protein